MRNLAKLDLDELDELEDSEDEAILVEFRNKRIAEMKELAHRSKFGSVREITGEEYVTEVSCPKSKVIKRKLIRSFKVNKAGEEIWVVLHLYAKGVPFCSLLNQYFTELAMKFPTVKFLRSIAQTCIPNFPEKNLPAIFIYHNGQMKKQFLGALDLRGPNITKNELEFLLGKVGAVDTEIKDDPRPAVKDKLFRDLAENNDW